MVMPIEPLTSMFSTMKNINHVVRTDFGDSESSINGRALDKPCQGILKDNDSGPISWIVTSEPTVEVLKYIGCVVFIKTEITKQSHKTIG